MMNPAPSEPEHSGDHGSAELRDSSFVARSLPEPVDSSLKQQYLEKFAAIGADTLHGNNNSVAGGYHPGFVREKFTGQFEGTRSLDDLVASFEAHNPEADGRFRSCGRYVVADAESLREAVRMVEEYPTGTPLEVEYYYPTKSGSFVLGLGINGEHRFDQFQNYTYSGSARPAAPEARFVPPAGRADLQEAESLQWGKFFLSVPVNPSIEIKEGPEELSVDQKYQLALLYMDSFGAGWSYEEVENFDVDTRILRVGVDRESGEVLGACVADSDELTAELTEWVVKPGSPHVGLMVANAIIQASEDRWPDKTLYGEFRTTSGSATQAFRMGFSLPDELEEVPNPGLIQANVKVQNEITDFATLCFSYDFERDIEELDSGEGVQQTPFGPAFKRTFEEK